MPTGSWTMSLADGECPVSPTGAEVCRVPRRSVTAVWTRMWAFAVPTRPRDRLGRAQSGTRTGTLLGSLRSLLLFRTLLTQPRLVPSTDLAYIFQVRVNLTPTNAPSQGRP